MSDIEDSLPSLKYADRVYYETGVLLNAEDFQAEQDYHRGRLARALSYVIGNGTVAGLKLNHEKEVPPGDPPEQGKEERLVLNPGLAIDPLGRLIEIPRSLCFRLNKWYTDQSDQDLRDGWHEAGKAWEGSPEGVVLDLLLRFHSCENGKTPSFAVGPFDSLDAVAPARIRDASEADLILRKEVEDPPASPWPDPSNFPDVEKANEALRKAIFEAYKPDDKRPTSVFIARIVIVAAKAPDEGRPSRSADKKVVINNKDRPFVLTGQALARWLGVDTNLGKDK